jgi:hypothetical protein
MPVPHFTKLQSSNIAYEAVYPSLFEITFILPQMLQAQGRDPLMLLENAQNIDLPLTPDITAVSQRFKYSTRVYLTLPEKTDTEFSIKFNLNVNDTGSIFVYNTLRAWYDLVWNSQTGSVFYKKDIAGSILISQHDKKGFVIRRVTYQNVQLNKLGQFSLSYDQNTQIHEPIEAGFVSDYWIDEMIDNNYVITPPSVY